MKFVFYLLTITSLITQIKPCKKFTDKIPSTFTINGKSYKKTKNCKTKIIETTGLPCEEIFETEKAKTTSYYHLVPINIDKYSPENQGLAEQYLIELGIYSKNIINKNSIINEDFIRKNCIEIELKKNKINPFDKYNSFEIGDDFKERLYHHFFFMKNLEVKEYEIDGEDNEQEGEDFLNTREFSLDSIIKSRFVDDDESDFHLFFKLKRALGFLKLIYEVLLDLVGVSHDSCAYMNQAVHSTTLSGFLFKRPDILEEAINQIENTEPENETGENGETDKKDSEEDNEERKLKGGMTSQDTIKLINSKISKNQIKYKKKIELSERKLTSQINNQNCKDFFIHSPIYIPDISLEDFVLTVPDFNYDQEIETTLKSETPTKLNPKYNYNFRYFSDSQLIVFFTLSSHTIPELLSKSVLTRYTKDPFFKLLKSKSPEANPINHKYFYFLSEFYKLFSEMIDRYIMPGVTFFFCFKDQRANSINSKCPVFLKVLRRVMVEEHVDVSGFLDLDLNYALQNPKRLVRDVRVFLEVMEKMADFYLEQVGEHDLRPIDDEAGMNDYNISSEFNNKLYERVREGLKEILKEGEGEKEEDGEVKKEENEDKLI